MNINILKKVKSLEQICGNHILIYNTINSKLYIRNIEYKNICNYTVKDTYKYNNTIYDFHEIVFMSNHNPFYYTFSLFDTYTMLIIVLEDNLTNIKYNLVSLLKYIDNKSKYNYNIEYILDLDISEYKYESEPNIIKQYDVNLHWIWFRYDNMKISNEMIDYSLSYINNNNDYKFNLWTNFESIDEIYDMLADIDEEKKNMLINNVIIHTYDEYIKIVDNIIENNNINEKSKKFLNWKLKSKDKYDILYITDLFRLILLWQFGGIYCDFNDCYCCDNMDIFFSIYGRDNIVLSNENFLKPNNYFIYTPANNELFIDIVMNIFNKIYLLNDMINDDYIKELMLSGIFNRKNRVNIDKINEINILLKEKYQLENMYLRLKYTYGKYQNIIKKDMNTETYNNILLLNIKLLEYTNIGLVENENILYLPYTVSNILICHDFNSLWMLK